MFYVPEILQKFPPLSILWLAAHKAKITKQQIEQFDIQNTIELLKEQLNHFSFHIQLELIDGLWNIYELQLKYGDQFEKQINKISSARIAKEIKDLNESISSQDYSIAEMIRANTADSVEIPPIIQSLRSIDSSSIIPTTTAATSQEQSKDLFSGTVTIQDPIPSAADHLKIPIPPIQEPLEIDPVVPAHSEAIPVAPGPSKPLEIIPSIQEPTLASIPLTDDQIIQREISSRETHRKIDEMASTMGQITLEQLDQSTVRSSSYSRRRRRPPALKVDRYTELSPRQQGRRTEIRSEFNRIVKNMYIPEHGLIVHTEYPLENYAMPFNSLKLRERFLPIPLAKEVIIEENEEEDLSRSGLRAQLEQGLLSPIPLPVENVVKKAQNLASTPVVQVSDEIDQLLDLPPLILKDQQQISNIISGKSQSEIEEAEIFRVQFEETMDKCFFANEELDENIEISFDRLEFPGPTTKGSIVSYFQHLLEAHENGKLELNQEQSLDEFKPLFIKRG